MGKKGANKTAPAASAAPAAPAAPAASAAPVVPAISKDAWLDSLTQEDRKLAVAVGCANAADLEREKKKLEERAKKASEAQRQQLWQNERNRQWEKEEEKKHREKNREDRKWQQVAAAAKQRGLQEGVLESHDYGDGTWWVQLEDGMWKEVQGQYWCTLCSKNANDATLADHLESKAHQNKLWQLPGAGSSSPSNGPSDAKAPPPPKATQASSPKPGPEAWQEVSADGVMRCIPCGKVVDECHLATAEHTKRLEAWQERQQLEKSGYAPPDLPYLAWVPADAANGQGERWLKCLLCGKWCQDDWSHSGSGGSKEHQKNLRNYGPGDPWYEENVVRQRLLYHPKKPPAVSSPSAAGQPDGSVKASRWGRPPAADDVVEC